MFKSHYPHRKNETTMQRSCLILQLLTLFACLLAQNQVEILPLSSYSAIEQLRENSQDRFTTSLAFFSLGLDDKAYEILDKYEPSDIEDRLRTFLLKTILAFRIGKYKACLQYAENLRNLKMWSQNLEKIYLSCLFSLEKWGEILTMYGQAEDAKYDSDMFYMVARSALKTGKSDLLANIFSKLTKEQRKELIIEVINTDPNALVKLVPYFEDLDPCLFALLHDKSTSVSHDSFNSELTEEIVKRCKRNA